MASKTKEKAKPKPKAAEAIEGRCNAKSPTGNLCSLPVDHHHTHKRHEGGRLVDEWANDNQPVAETPEQPESKPSYNERRIAEGKEPAKQ